MVGLIPIITKYSLDGLCENGKTINSSNIISNSLIFKKIIKNIYLGDHFLELIELPVSAMGCDIECKISEHTQGIDSLYESFICVFVQAAQLSVLSSSNHATRTNRLAV